MTSTKVIALDVMSGDSGPRLYIEAALSALKCYPDLHMILVGHHETLNSLLASYHAKYSAVFSRFTIEHADTVISMSQKPSHALRYGQSSSLWKAVSLVKEKRAHACVSAGNTGAYMAIGRLLLNTFPFIDRPAIIGRLPGVNRRSFMLDLGANIECTPLHLYQYAVMGSALLSEVYGIERPSIGLLNVGSEDNKGNRRIKEAKAYIERDASLNFSRYVEGHELCLGVVDLIVCDGFAGNIALKSAEGAARYIRRRLLSGNKSGWGRFLYWMALPWLSIKVKGLDPGVHNGALLLGLQGILVKSHGAAHRSHFLCAIEQAISEIDKNTVACIAKKTEGLSGLPL